jgi:hypothetical protein
MGCDIHGWIECYSEDIEWLIAEGPERAERLNPWRGVLHLTAVAPGRNYELWGGLFGVRNRLGFRPIAEGRGRPPAVSAILRQAFEEVDALEREWGHGEFHSYTWITSAELAAVDWDELSQVAPDYPRGDGAVPDGHAGGGPRPIQRAETLDPEWEVVLAVMRHLGSLWGPERVRLVVWFDG